MDPHVYARMASLEDRHWWFVARRRILAEVMRRLVVLPREARILEAGCGTGGNLGLLSAFGEVEAFEPASQARNHARSKGTFEVRDGSLPDRVPFALDRYDLVAAFDILEHVDDDTGSMKQLFRQLRPGGWAVITVPAFPFLWSRHDELHHHKRRYRKSELVARLREAGFESVRASYFNSVLFPLVVLVRLVKRLLRADNGDDEAEVPAALNRLLEAIFASERHLIGRLPLLFGVSLLAIARRPE